METILVDLEGMFVYDFPLNVRIFGKVLMFRFLG